MKTNFLLIIFLVFSSIGLQAQNLDKAKKCYMQKDYDCAIKYLNKALDDKSATKYVIYNNLGATQDKIGKYDDAIESFSNAIKEKADYKEAYYNRALVYEKLERYDEALNDYNAVLKLDPENEDVLMNRATIYKQTGKDDLAKADLETVVKINSKNFGARVNLATIKKGDELEASIADFKAILKDFPPRAIVYNNLADSEMQLNQLDSALKHINKALEIDPKYANGYLTRGEIHQKMGNKDLACKEFKKYLQIGKDEDEEDIAKANVYLKECKD